LKEALVEAQFYFTTPSTLDFYSLFNIAQARNCRCHGK
jgi:hypothetical protein